MPAPNKLCYGLIIALMLILAGCTGDQVAVKPAPEPLWPAPSASNWHWYIPQGMPSADYAIGVLKNLQNSIVEHNTLRPFSKIDVDKYGFRGTYTWVETEVRDKWVPTYGSYSWGWHTIDAYSYEYLPNTYTSLQTETLIVPFTDIWGLVLEESTFLSQTFPWKLVVTFKGKPQVVVLRITDEASARQLGDALATLALDLGNQLRTPRTGLSARSLSQRQSAALGLPPDQGILIYQVAMSGPGEKAGLKFGDAVLSADGKTVKNFKDLLAACDRPGQPPANLKVLRRIQGQENPSTVATEIRFGLK